jgi:hypothetical protein
MKAKVILKVAGLTGLLALIAAGYCFWLMTVPLSYDWVPVVLIGFVVARRVYHLRDHFLYFFRAIASTRAPNVPQTRPDHLTSRVNRH